MELQAHLERIANKLDAIDDKLDSHLERISKAEERIDTLRSFSKQAKTLFLGIAVALLHNHFGLPK
jgi:peptidoglycan hydrolase CwlO-like protein